MSTQTSSSKNDDYAKVWRLVLSSWLHWPEQRIQKFISRLQPMLDAPGWFDGHRSPIWYLHEVLMSPDMRRRFPVTSRINIGHEIDKALGWSERLAQLGPDYDWDSAKLKVEAVLARHGGRLPLREELSWYEEDENHVA